MTYHQPQRLKKLVKIIALLKERSCSLADIVIRSKIHSRTVPRCLDDLRFLGLVGKKEGYWFWKPYMKIYRSKHDFEIDLDHSRKLIPGLEAILAEDRFGWVGKESEWAQEVKTLGMELKQYAEAHIGTGDPVLLRKIEAHRKLCGRTERKLEKQGYSKALIKYIIHGVETIPGPVEFENFPDKMPEVLKEIIEEKLESYQRLASSVEFLKKKILMNEPLGGRCQLCPNISVAQ